ncbi:hypothetical protein QR685DRAFT_471707, partial [Neurospora intermedia]
MVVSESEWSEHLPAGSTNARNPFLTTYYLSLLNHKVLNTLKALHFLKECLLSTTMSEREKKRSD